MDKFKSFFKKHKKKCIIVGVCLLILIIFISILFFVISYFMPNDNESFYGDRCEQTENYPVSSDLQDKIATFIKDYEGYELVEFDVKCNLITFILKVPDSTEVKVVKEMSKNLLTVFNEDELKYYDIHLSIKSDNEKSENYPIMGTHHKEIKGSSNDDFVW